MGSTMNHGHTWRPRALFALLVGLSLAALIIKTAEGSQARKPAPGALPTAAAAQPAVTCDLDPAPFTEADVTALLVLFLPLPETPPPPKGKDKKKDQDKDPDDPGDPEDPAHHAPEPATLLTAGMGALLLGLAGLRRRFGLI